MLYSVCCTVCVVQCVLYSVCCTVCVVQCVYSVDVLVWDMNVCHVILCMFLVPDLWEQMEI